MGVKKKHKPTNTAVDYNLPVPESDHNPLLTKFVNDVGFFYEKTFDWTLNHNKQSTAHRNKFFAGIAKYLNEAFAEALRRELNLLK